MLEVISFIHENQNWRDLLSGDPYRLSLVTDGGFTILNYSQYDSDFMINIVRECRGLIIDAECQPVCIPFFKFANYGEAYADTLDWQTASIEEKIDGSLIKLWNYKGEWIISTNRTIFAKNAVLSTEGLAQDDSKYSNFAELFKAAADKAQLDYDRLDPDHTYMFELVSPFNKVVVSYESPAIYHIGTRNNISLKEKDIDIGVQKPRVFSCDNLADLIEMASELSYNEEGYVVKDAGFKRLKVKSPAYVAAQHLITGINQKRLLEIMKENETSEFLTYFPEYKREFAQLSLSVERLTNYIEEVHLDKIAGRKFQSRKDYAEVVSQTLFPAYFFMLYDGKVQNPYEWIWSLPADRMLEQLARVYPHESVHR